MSGFDLEAARQRALAAGKPIAPVPPQTSATASNYSEFTDTASDLSFYTKSAFDQQMDSLLDSLGILEFYKLFCGKMTPKVGNRTESIMVSCPKPNHRDSNPSAWISLEKGTWFCGACQEGGDGYDIAAYNLGFSVPGYKHGKTFHELRSAIAGRLGYSVVTSISGRNLLVGPGGSADDGAEDPAPSNVPQEPAAPNPPAPLPAAPEAERPAPALPNTPVGGTLENPVGIEAFLKPRTQPQPAQQPALPVEPPAAPAQPPTTVTPIATEANVAADGQDDADLDRDFQYPSIEWRSLVPQDTFLRAYMETTAEDDIPDEYNFFNGLAAIGLALGRDTVLADRNPVVGNLFVCTIGQSGSGKSQASRHLEALLRIGAPHQWDDPSTRGVRYIPTPGSGEQLISSFVRRLAPDPSKPKELLAFPVRGFVEFPEFADLVGRSARIGSTLSSTLMHFYDARPRVTSASRTGGELEAVDPFCSVLTTTQLKSIRLLMRTQDAASGFLNRWLFTMGPPKVRHFFGGSVIDMMPAVRPFQGIVGWAPSVTAIHVGDEGRRLMGSWWKGTAERVKLEDTTDIFSRIDLTIKKLILLFAANKHEKIVSKETIQTVIDLFPYLVDSYNAVINRVGSSEEGEIVNSVLHAISGHFMKYGKDPTVREIGIRITKGKYKPTDIAKVIKTMIQLELIEEIPPVKIQRGRPAIRYRIVS